jgi:hypothetical protein
MRGAAPTKARCERLVRARLSQSIATRAMVAAARDGRAAALRGEERVTPYVGRGRRLMFLRLAWLAGFDTVTAAERSRQPGQPMPDTTTSGNER